MKSLLLFSVVVIVAIIIIISARATFSKAAPGSQTLATSVTSASPAYVGAEQCGNCHTSIYAGWNQTNHAHAIMLIQNASGNFYSIGASSNLNGTPSRVYNETGFRNSCRNCHVTGGNNWDPINEGLTGANRTWPEMATDPAKFLNIQCEACHGAYQSHGSTNRAMIVNYTAALCEQCHSPGTSHDFSYWQSAHTNSLTVLMNSSHALDSCLSCMSAQGSLGIPVTLNTTNLASVSCVTCHDVHSRAHEGQLRYEESTELCGQCHSQAEVFEDGAHSRAGLECTSCHGQGTFLSHGEESPVMNHTWRVYGMHYPYNQTRGEEPIVCSNCHTQEWATTQLGVIQELTEELVANVTQGIDNAKAAITLANQTAGVNKTIVGEAARNIETAEDILGSMERDGSKGFHNPEQTYAELSEASRLASGAEITALSAKAEALGQNVTQIASLQAQILSLQNQTTTLQGRIDSLQASTTTTPYLYGGVGVAIGFVVGAAIMFAVRKRKQ